MAVSYIPRYPVILSIENHCTVPQQKKMAESLMEVLQGKVDLSTVNMNEFRKLPSPELLKREVLVKVEPSFFCHFVVQPMEALSHFYSDNFQIMKCYPNKYNITEHLLLK